jgi:hypothetical protein
MIARSKICHYFKLTEDFIQRGMFCGEFFRTQVLCNIYFMLKKHFLTCEISSSHGGEYDVQNCLLGCTAV